MPIAAAIAVAAVAGGAATVYSANKAAGASSKALTAQMAQQDKIRADVEPFLTSGKNALMRITDPASVNANFMASPDYNFRLKSGLDAVTQNKAVNGLLKSGGALKAVTKYAGDTASGEFGNWWNRQSGLVNEGLTAENAAAGVANNNTNAIGANATNQGNAALASGNAIGSTAGSLADLIAKYSPPPTSSSYAATGKEFNWT